jgi:AraC-like DNA-binding protein
MSLMDALPCPPAELAHLVNAIGVAATLRLIEVHGGTRVYVAQEDQVNQGTVLARSVGLEAARRLGTLYGREWLPVPLARAWRVQLYKAQGATVKAIATRLGMTESGVARILRDTSAAVQRGRPRARRTAALLGQKDMFG